MIVSSPGRICLFGEHQDYLGLPVIAAAISLRLTIEGSHRDDMTVSIDLPDMDENETFSIKGDLVYEKKADYFRSAINVMRKDGFTFSAGFDCSVNGDIPIQAGTASSSAMVVSWINFLARMSDQKADLDPEMIADLAYRAEVVEFREAGGMMDQYVSALGGVIYLESEPEVSVERLACRLGTFVLGDSLEEKDTQVLLGKSKERVLDITLKIRDMHRDFSLSASTADDIAGMRDLSVEEKHLLSETLRNRDLTHSGLAMLQDADFDDDELGDFLNRQHAILRDALDVSTTMIETMLKAADSAGALGGKINGSGGGGCMFAYAPDNPEKVAEAIERVGGKAYTVHVDEGLSTDG